MKLLIGMIFYIVCFYYISKKKNSKEKVLEYLPLFFPIAFDIALSSNVYRVVGEDLKFYINTATLLLICYVFFLRKRKMFAPKAENIFFSILLVNIFFQMIIYQNDIGSFPMFLRLFLNYLSIYLCMVIALGSKGMDTDQFLSNFNYVAIFNGILGILQILTRKKLLLGSFNESIIYTEGVIDTYRAVGLAGSNNSGGNLALLLFVIVIFNYVKKRDLVSLIATILTLLFAFLTQTRIALLAIVVVIMMIFIFTPLSKSLKKYILFSGATLGLVITALFSEKIIYIFFKSRGNTAGYRFLQLDRAVEYGLSKHPFLGIGTGQWRSYLYNEFEIVDIPLHSQMLNFLVENGIFIFIGFCIFNGILIWKLLKNQGISRERKLFALSLFVGNLIVSNFNPNQVYTINNVIYYLVFFVLVYHQENTQKT